MRLPSSPSLWTALFGSLLIHAGVALCAWYLATSATPVTTKIATCVEETTERLQLSVVFGSVGPARQPTNSICTQVEAQPPMQEDATLEDAPMFNTTPEFVPPLSASNSRNSDSHSVEVPTGPSVAGIQLPGGNSLGAGVGQRGTGGPGDASFFQVGATAKKIVYVIDSSMSMGLNGAFNRARAELLANLQQLPADVQFQVLAYNHLEPHCLVQPEHLQFAQPAIVTQFVQALSDRDLLPAGKTNHVAALKHALFLNPDAIYWVTDGDDFSPPDLSAVSQAIQGRTAIHVIVLVTSDDAKIDSPLRQLASSSGGTYRAVNIAQQLTAIPGPRP